MISQLEEVPSSPVALLTDAFTGSHDVLSVRDWKHRFVRAVK
jgi:hypothetical protein